MYLLKYTKSFFSFWFVNFMLVAFRPNFVGMCPQPTKASKESRPALVSNRTSIAWVQEPIYSGLKYPANEDAHCQIRPVPRLEWVEGYLFSPTPNFHMARIGEKVITFCLISGFSCYVNEICSVLEYHEAWNGGFLTTFRYNLSVPSPQVQLYP